MLVSGYTPKKEVDNMCKKATASSKTQIFKVKKIQTKIGPMWEIKVTKKPKK